jgi:microsomal dipeptidase-like Zn-dependent dipeptidase
MKSIKRAVSVLALCGVLTSVALGQDAPTRIKLPLPQLPPGSLPLVRIEMRLWGWADLHAHPASHLSFGANASGNDGIFWGKPGLDLNPSTLLADMPACSPDKHGSFDADVVRHKTHQQVISTIDNITGYTHGPNGASGFGNWPNARSLTHQQMHVTNLRRAYDGGQRVMVASVTDNEFLSALWSKIGYNAAGNQVPLRDPDQGFNSAQRQLVFIKQLAARNPTWMEVAYSAADARRIVAGNKLALILSLEIDSLTPAQTLRLVREQGVRHVIPVHLINNDVGGTAVYTDAFNTANAFVNSTRQSGNWNNLGNDGFFEVKYDTKLSGRLGRPQTLVAEGANLLQGGAIWPRAIDDGAWATLGYDSPLELGGHRNRRGLSTAGQQLLRELAKLGVLLDVAHMSQESTGSALQFAVSNEYPVMDSHTGLRSTDEKAENERSLMREHARKIASLGGMIGLGTEGTAGRVPIVSQPVIATPGHELIRFTGDLSTRTWQVSRIRGNPIVSNLTVTIVTGGDDLRGGNNWVKAQVTINGRASVFELSKGAKWDNGSTHAVTIALPAGTRADAISAFGLVANPNGHNDFILGNPIDSPDNWNVDSLKVEATLADVDSVGTWLGEFKEALALMNGRGMAIGTDANGFAPMMPFSGQPVDYPITVAARTGLKPDGYTPPALARDRMGTRTFDFRTDGIAQYGMLPDFLQAVSQKPDSAAAVKALFLSANDLVVMWERCEARKASIR